MSYYLLKPCRTTAGYVATPKRDARLDLDECFTTLESAGFKVTNVNVLLIVRGEPEMTLYKSGKVLAKTNDEEAARRAIEELYGVLDIGVKQTTRGIARAQ